MLHRLLGLGVALGLLLTAAAPAVAHDPGRHDDGYVVNQLVSTATDPDLVNGWGLSRGPTTPWWVADNGTDKSTLYNATGAKQALVVTIPGGAPTGTVFNGNGGSFNAGGNEQTA
jgi:hypothetical protein